jgi:hypothetical protein
MNTDQLNERIKLIIQSASNLQEFADLTPPEENWERTDKNINVPD